MITFPTVIFTEAEHLPSSERSVGITQAALNRQGRPQEICSEQISDVDGPQTPLVISINKEAGSFRLHFEVSALLCECAQDCQTPWLRCSATGHCIC